MKKIIFSCVAVATFALGCSKIEITDTNKDAPGAINFTNYIGNVTKATDVTTPLALAGIGGFKVYGYATDKALASATTVSLLMNNISVISADDGVNWTYTPIQYWPVDSDNKVQFFIYANPASGALTNWSALTTSVKPSFDYTSPASSADQKDLLYASAYNENKHGTTDKVDLTFKHALTRINFAARTNKEGVHAKISSITLANVYEEGTFTYGAGNSTGSWSGVNTAFTNPITYPIKTTENVAYHSIDFAKNFQESNASLMLIPSNNSTITLQIKFTLYNTANQAITAEITKNATIDGSSSAWEIGKNICYNLILDDSSLTPIIFSVTSNFNWDGETGTGVTYN